MTDLVIPYIGDIWQDANGNHNLILSINEKTDRITTLCLEKGQYWHDEVIDDWNDPSNCTANDGKPFYRLLIA